MTTERYQICNRCIMDTTDPEIKFNDQGYCSHCTTALDLAKEIWYPDEKGEKLSECDILTGSESRRRRRNLTALSDLVVVLIVHIWLTWRSEMDYVHLLCMSIADGILNRQSRMWKIL